MYINKPVARGLMIFMNNANDSNAAFSLSFMVLTLYGE